MAEVLHESELTDDEPSDYGALRPGKHLGRYELLVPIARGGMARVWAARQHGQRGFQKLVAIKTILPNLAEEPEFERMFLDEARIASGVHHPNVCEIYELGEEKKTLYLAMEWVSGDSLSRILRPTGKQTDALEPRVVARIIADACAGVHAAHELTDEDGRQLGVVHRDLSPHNVLLSADGHTKVCDFGVAKALGQLHEQTSGGQLKGKLSYMSPEQITGGAVDRRSDVFSLGCVLYEATTGVRPFKGERDYMIMQAIMSGEVEPPSSIMRGFPQDLERIILRALAHQPILRYPSAERMRFALEEFLTKGQLVTTNNVAHAVRARIGDLLDRRKERIRQASSQAEQTWDPANAGSMRDPVEHRSGVKQTGTVEIVEEALRPPSPIVGPPSLPMGPPQSLAPRSMPPAFSMELDQTMHGHGIGSSETMLQAPVADEGRPRPPSTGPTQTLAMSPVYTPQESEVRAPSSSPNVNEASPAEIPNPTPSLPDTTLALAQHPLLQAEIPTKIRTLPAPPPSTSHLEERPASNIQYVLAAFAGLLVALLIGAGGFYIWTSRQPPPQETTPAIAPTTPSARPIVPAASPEIMFQLTPPNATLVIDGKEVPPEVRSMPRPPAGRTSMVVVRAKGFDDASFMVDYFTASPHVITLKPIIELDSPPATSNAGKEPKDPAPKGHSPRTPRPNNPAVVPENPY